MRDPAENPRMPWDGIVEMVFGAKDTKPKKVNPWDGVDTTPKDSYKPQPLKQDKQFETVFSKLIQAESRGQHTDKSGKLITSSAGATGISQLMGPTAAKPGYGVEPLKDKSEAEYLRVGRDYLKAMLKEFDGDYRKAVAAYNAGPGNIKKAVAKGGVKWEDHLPKPSETKPYMKKILGE